MEHEKPRLKLIGLNGNAFVILGAMRRAGKEAGWSKEKIDQVLADAMSGDYNHLLQVAMKNFEVE